MIEVARIAASSATDICANQCQAKCCRTPGSTPIVSTVEMRELQHVARERGVKLRFLNAAGHSVTVTATGDVLLTEPTERHHMLRDRWVMLRAKDGCQFLGQGTNLCTIYDERPRACREFPMRPTQGCLLTPDATEKDPSL